MLKEVGFQAGQHEVIAEAFSKEIARNVSKQVKELREDRRKNKRVSEKLVNDLNSAYSEMTKSKDLFRKSFEEQERTNYQPYSRAMKLKNTNTPGPHTALPRIALVSK